MEQEKKKKKREREGEEKHSYQEHPRKKQHLDKENYPANNQHIAYENAAIDSFCSCGVFDFPWLNEDMISKSEDWKLEGTFWSSLGDFLEPCWCQMPTIPVDLLLDKVDDQPWKCQDGKLENLDESLWSSVLNQPLVEGDV